MPPMEQLFVAQAGGAGGTEAGDVLAFEALRRRALNKGTNDRGREYETV